MLGRTFAIAVVTLWCYFAALAPALAADAILEEKEHRSQQVVIVKPEEWGIATEADELAEKITELERAILEARHKRSLLEMKLKLLEERVKAERRKIEAGHPSSPRFPTATDGSRQDEGQKVPRVTESTDDSFVVREYIWVPQHREGDKVIEGSYQLRAR